jgi:acetyl esterase
LGLWLYYRLSPLLATDLGGLAPALVMVAGFDVLRDEGIAYADRLAAAGNHVVLVDYPGLSHGFIGMSDVLDGARQAVAQIASALKAALAK